MDQQQLNHTVGTIHIFDFEPGDGHRYRVLFGRLPPIHQLFGGYILFGLGEGTDAMITIVVTSEAISRDSFAWPWRQVEFVQPWSDPMLIEATAYTIFCALVGVTDMPKPPEPWITSWRDQLPLAAMG